MQTVSEMSSRTTREVERIKHHAATAQKAIEWLFAEKFEPMEILVQQERRAPIIRIALSPRCEWLKKEFIAFKHEITATHVTWRANVMGVRVQWVEKGN